MASPRSKSIVVGPGGAAENAQALVRALAGQGWSVTVAESAEAVVRMAAAGRADSLILDLAAPDADAAQLLVALGSEASLAEVPVLLLCPAQPPAEWTERLKLANVDYLSGPREPQDVIHRLNRLFLLRRLVEGNRRGLDLALSYTCLATLGALAAGLAHTYNNLLGVIVGRLQMIQRAVGPTSKTHENAEKALGAARRMAEMAWRLLDLARREKVDMKSHNLVEVVRDSVEQARPLVPPGVVLEWATGLADCAIKGIRPLLERAFVSVLEDAAGALGQGGQVFVSLDITALPAPLLDAMVEKRASEYARVSVRAAGPALADAVRQTSLAPGKIDEPSEERFAFLIAEGTVRAHCGAMEVTTESETARSVHIYLPCHGQTGAAASEP